MVSPRFPRLLPAALAALALLAGPAAAPAQERPRLSGAAAAIVVDARDGSVLLAKNPRARRSIASATKLMTALLTLERSRSNRVFRGTDYQAGAAESKINLGNGERMRVGDLLEALLLESANDAAVALAQGISGSRRAFVEDMNARAGELGLRGTSYANPIGLDDSSNYSTAADLATLTRRLLRNRRFAQIVRMPRAQLESGSRPRLVDNRNELVRDGVRPVTGVKTGHTGAAGYVLIGSGTRHGVTLVSAVLGTSSEASRNASTLALLGYGFSGFSLEHPVAAGSVVARPTVNDSPGVRVPVLATRSVSEVVARNARLTVRVDVPRRLAGPMPDRAVVGSVVVSAGRRVLARVPVELSRALPAVSGLTLVGRFFSRPTTLVLLVLLIGGASVFVRRRRGGRRDQGTADEFGAAALEPAVARERAAAAERILAAERAARVGRAGADPAAAAERERRRAEREARRKAGQGDPASSSARERG